MAADRHQAPPNKNNIRKCIKIHQLADCIHQKFSAAKLFTAIWIKFSDPPEAEVTLAIKSATSHTAADGGEP
jgi:hypothetical protein